jgi:transcriptional regulator with XRE-family HTH domain
MKSPEKTDDKLTTRSLSRVLERARSTEDFEEFFDGSAKDEDLHTFLNRIITKNTMTVADVARRSGVNSNYIYNIFNGVRKNPGRDKVIALAVGCRMTFSETNRALELAGLAPLYPRDERDVRVAISINRGVEDVTQLNIDLDRHGLEPLDI